jgi:hypothetical protein
MFNGENGGVVAIAEQFISRMSLARRTVIVILMDFSWRATVRPKVTSLAKQWFTARQLHIAKRSKGRRRPERSQKSRSTLYEHGIPGRIRDYHLLRLAARKDHTSLHSTLMGAFENNRMVSSEWDATLLLRTCQGNLALIQESSF